MRLFLLSIALLPGVARPVIAEAADAAALLNEGRADEAEHLLLAELALNQRDATAHQLLCRVYYSEERFNAAIHECEAAVANNPGSSEDQLWLGRSYGMKASQANPILAFTLARKVVAAFERAVELDPANVAAMRDLGEYYVNAPGIVGGGLDKGRTLATRLAPVSAAKAHRLLGQIAEKTGDYATAEAEFRSAVDAQRTADSYVDLAQFYLGRKQFDRASAAVQTAARLDRPRDASAVDAAAILVSEDHMLPLAEQLLREYLASPAKSDGAPVCKVRLQLGDLLLKRGEPANAKVEYDAALALAAGFAPALRARDQITSQAAHRAVSQPASRPGGANAVP